jgi:hypothetical protein
VPYSPKDSDIEYETTNVDEDEFSNPWYSICAIHGLNGNAFDTWVAKTNKKMWLRDLLPSSKPFHKARIMTFGYSSQLSDRSNLSGMGEWAHHLLVSMSSVRQTPQVGFQISKSPVIIDI